jgi:hypothetical protein
MKFLFVTVSMLQAGRFIVGRKCALTFYCWANIFMWSGPKDTEARLWGFGSPQTPSHFNCQNTDLNTNYFLGRSTLQKITSNYSTQVKLALFPEWRRVGGIEVYFHTLLNSVPDRGEQLLTSAALPQSKASSLLIE